MDPAGQLVGIFGGSGFYSLLDDVNLMLVTDYDAGLEGRRSSCAPGQAGCFAQEPDVAPVSADMAFEVFSRNLDRLRALLFRAVPRIGPQPECVCASALGSAVVH